MIYVNNIRAVRTEDFDEVWAIVRSLKKPVPGIIQVPELSPSWKTFSDYMEQKKQGNWNYDTFVKQYVPNFIDDIHNNQKAFQTLNNLVKKHRNGKKIALVCFCPDEKLCHRSIIAGFLQFKGFQVDGILRDYSSFGELL